MKIRNANDLKVEIARLTLVKKEQESYLKDQYLLLKYKMNAPARFFNRFLSFLPNFESGDISKGLFSMMDPGKQGAGSKTLSRSLRLIVPLILNRTFLRKSGWLKKGLVLFASDSVLGQLDKDKLEGIFENILGFFKTKTKRRKKDKNPIPRYNEFSDTPFAGDLPLEDEQAQAGKKRRRFTKKSEQDKVKEK
ncbi:MAG TPA: hypothetical protein VK102_03235 [Sphingobacterium sp.]|nr:hypothetical protein [Sphingobacterium sp.]